jgi:hypothetical protein
LINHFHTINNGVKELLAHNEYDELGQLKSKSVGGQDVTTFEGLQKINYQYNIRGWLTDINNVNDLDYQSDPLDLFAFKINYNQPNLASGETTSPR